MTELETSDSRNKRVNTYVLHKIPNLSIDWRQNAKIHSLYMERHMCLEKDLGVQAETQVQTSHFLPWFRRI
jgi:hypothetical protein